MKREGLSLKDGMKEAAYLPPQAPQMVKLSQDMMRWEFFRSLFRSCKSSTISDPTNKTANGVALWNKIPDHGSNMILAIVATNFISKKKRKWNNNNKELAAYSMLLFLWQFSCFSSGNSCNFAFITITITIFTGRREGWGGGWATTTTGSWPITSWPGLHLMCNYLLCLCQCHGQRCHKG